MEGARQMPELPNNARIAILPTVMLESWSEGKSPAYSPMTTPLKEGQVDLLGISWADYGGKTGIWRIMRILDEFNIKATICVSGRAAERFPEAVKKLSQKGHELAGHAYTQDQILCTLSPEKEKEVILQCRDIIERTTGVRPTGWFSPRATPTEHTAKFLAEEGFLWHGDYNDTDLPYTLKSANGTLVAIPHSDFVDNRVLRASPRNFFEVYKDTFDFLYRSEKPAMINLTVHAHFGGRPMMSAVIHDVLKYLSGFPRVWFARHDEIARWALKETKN